MGMKIAGICELVLETDDVKLLTSFYRELGLELGDRSVYFSDSAGKRVELWDFFRDGDGAEGGVMALAEDGDGA
jgi:catechol 2,3-dioxygenase-like lactoylglutathione lyase family enzyme